MSNISLNIILISVLFQTISFDFAYGAPPPTEFIRGKRSIIHSKVKSKQSGGSSNDLLNPPDYEITEMELETTTIMQSGEPNPGEGSKDGPQTKPDQEKGSKDGQNEGQAPLDKTLPVKPIPFNPNEKPEPEYILKPNPRNLDMIFTRNSLKGKSGIAGDKFRWKKGFYVQLDPTFTKSEYKIIMSALGRLAGVLCVGVRYWPKDTTPTGDYVYIIRGENGEHGTGCWSGVGKAGGKQVLNLQFDYCMKTGIVLHEMIHAVGYYHEQNRPDRDQYLNIHYDAMKPEYKEVFNTDLGTLTFGIPYDLHSIMHYDAWGFASGDAPTMTTKDNGTDFGGRGIMTIHDRDKIRKMYNCPIQD